MKYNGSMLALVVVLLVCMVQVVGVAAETNLVVNGSFEEEWTVVSADTPEKLRTVGWTANVLHHDELGPAPDKVDGRSALRMVSTTRRNAQFLNSVSIAVDGGKTYKFSYWLYMKDGITSIAVVNNTAGAFIRETQMRHFADDYMPGEWQYFEFVFTLPETCEAIRVSLSQSPLTENERTEYYLDDVRIVQLD
ncbi:MAG TPA: hypothetical protein GXZ82_01200 [Firmicutes bacterium]|nr:hypothetical protein [Bacillota bacterium]